MKRNPATKSPPIVPCGGPKKAIRDNTDQSSKLAKLGELLLYLIKGPSTISVGVVAIVEFNGFSFEFLKVSALEPPPANR